MNAAAFNLYVETQRTPTLQQGDVVVLDNLSLHKSPKAKEILANHGASFLFLLPYSPDLNPPDLTLIEMAFSKIKALLRNAAASTYGDLWQGVGKVCDLFSDEEYYNYLKAAGYERN